MRAANCLGRHGVMLQLSTALAHPDRLCFAYGDPFKYNPCCLPPSPSQPPPRLTIYFFTSTFLNKLFFCLHGFQSAHFCTFPFHIPDCYQWPKSLSPPPKPFSLSLDLYFEHMTARNHNSSVWRMLGGISEGPWLNPGVQQEASP